MKDNYNSLVLILIQKRFHKKTVLTKERIVVRGKTTDIEFTVAMHKELYIYDGLTTWWESCLL